MTQPSKLTEFGFSQYETACYLALAANHPSNGSQLSKLSGVARSRIYDVLRNLIKKGLVFEVESGLYVPLPPDELKKRLKTQVETDLSILEDQLNSMSRESNYEHILTIKGYEEVINKACEIIDSSKQELYVRLFPETGKHLEKKLLKAAKRGVKIRYISMGQIPLICEIQVVHPECENIMTKIGGESIDIIADKSEALVGIFETNRKNTSPIIWTHNKSFIIGNRDSLRHDFYHYFLNKVYDRKQELTKKEQKIYEFIKNDN
ncbi:putative sugar-specific transcriptional regulator [Desulfonema limicola]|uniref:Sugar-specific transcriptional regulator n=1 Tax=Desulfonema limicola TaxID=45656 RepID=A0A975B4Y8_9BACT|nr:TrmB family transcriptional regulator [Desulfonema limicola]QTA78872.1 putative sugar-specific transcriptional regulator [Desulfonema limicola]